MRKTVILSIIMLLVSVAVFAQITLTSKIGVQMLGNHKATLMAISQDNDVDMGYSIVAECGYTLLGIVEAGLGLEYQLYRPLTDYTDNLFGFNPIYGYVRGKIPLPFISPFAIGKAGYNLYSGNNYYSGGYTLNGGLYWSIGAGVFIINLVVVELAYSTNYGNLEELDINVEYSHLDVYVGVSYKF